MTLHGISVPPEFRGVRTFETADQTGVVTATPTDVTFSGENYDTDGYHSATNSQRLTVPAGLPGIYEIFGSIRPDDNGGNFYWQLLINYNGSTDIDEDVQTMNGTNPVYRSLHVYTQYRMVGGDYVKLTVNQNSGANKIVRHSFKTGVFGMRLIS